MRDSSRDVARANCARLPTPARRECCGAEPVRASCLRRAGRRRRAPQFGTDDLPGRLLGPQRGSRQGREHLDGGCLAADARRVLLADEWLDAAAEFPEALPTGADPVAFLDELCAVPERA